MTRNENLKLWKLNDTNTITPLDDLWKLITTKLCHCITRFTIYSNNNGPPNQDVLKFKFQHKYRSRNMRIGIIFVRNNILQLETNSFEHILFKMQIKL